MGGSWECLAEILASDLTDGMVCDIGLPVEQGGVRYNCRAYCLNGQILLIRPKLYLANDGNYRETRWFSAWKHLRQLVTLQLPETIKEVTGQEDVPFGDGYLAFEDTWALFSSQLIKNIRTCTFGWGQSEGGVSRKWQTCISTKDLNRYC